jgi:hypothetical protein
MKIDPHTTREHIISVYGHITGLKKEICTIKEQSSQTHAPGH